MDMPLKIVTIFLNPETDKGHIFDMTRRCAFALCVRGEFVIKIFNERYAVKEHYMFACMPFINIEVTDVLAPCEIVVGYIDIENVPSMINRWVNTTNLSDIQNHPMVYVQDSGFNALIASIDEYVNECNVASHDSGDATCNRIQQDIIIFLYRLIIARVIKIYFSTNCFETGGYTHKDEVFQRFMLMLYRDFREHRDVQYYAMRSGVSVKYFSTVVRQLSGTSPSVWIETVVIGEAKSMLNDIQRSIKDIAITLNFPDASTFTKYFRRLAGMTPKDYRKSLM